MATSPTPVQQDARAALGRLLGDGRGKLDVGAAGLLSSLMGGRRLASGRNALILGGIGLLGKVAFEAWQRRGSQPDGQRPLVDLGHDPESERRAATLLHAMVAAAKADGHLDEEEESAIEAEMEDLPDGARSLMRRAMASSLTPEAVAARVEGRQEAHEVYAASALLSGREHPGEADHLDRLARALGLSPDEAREIEDTLHAV